MKSKLVRWSLSLPAVCVLLAGTGLVGCASVTEASASGGADAVTGTAVERADAEESSVDAPEPGLSVEKSAPVASSSATPPKVRGAKAGGLGGDSGFVTSNGPSESGLSAGVADDNRQYGYFLDFLQEYSEARHIDIDISERIMLRLHDSAGKSVPNALVTISAEGNVLEKGRSLADGTYQFNPTLYSVDYNHYGVEISGSAGSSALNLSRNGQRTIEVAFEKERVLPQSIPLDVVFVLDTTGSMGEEIDRLRRTIELIHLNLTTLSVPTTVRFGLVLYKDAGDDYRTRTVPLTSDLASFQAELDTVRASGGGDTPEDLQAALEESVRGIEWNSDGIRLSFIITDAPPHLDYGQPYDYATAVRDARAMGMKIFSVGTGGLGIDGEYVLRQIAQFTGGTYIFLTYGERGESSGGAPGSVSHHTGANYQTDKLESIIIRLAKEELSQLTDAPIESAEPYFTASKIDSEEREKTVSQLFSQAIEQLADFSTIALSSDLPVAVLPIVANEDPFRVDAEYFTEQLVLAASRSDRMALVERRNLQKVLEEQKIQLSGLTDPETVTKIGSLMNAQVLMVGTLYEKDGYDLFLRLLRVETGEVLSVTKALIDPNLGVSGSRR